MAEETIWEKQATLRKWHEENYVKEYPSSVFNTGRTLCADDAKYEALTAEEKERKENAAYLLNSMLFSLGVNLSSNFTKPEEAR